MIDKISLKTTDGIVVHEIGVDSKNVHLEDTSLTLQDKLDTIDTKAIKNHAAPDDVYGAASDSEYGHVKLGSSMQLDGQGKLIVKCAADGEESASLPVAANDSRLKQETLTINGTEYNGTIPISMTIGSNTNTFVVPMDEEKTVEESNSCYFQISLDEISQFNGKIIDFYLYYTDQNYTCYKGTFVYYLETTILPSSNIPVTTLYETESSVIGGVITVNIYLENGNVVFNFNQSKTTNNFPPNSYYGLLGKVVEV